MNYSNDNSRSANKIALLNVINKYLHPSFAVVDELTQFVQLCERRSKKGRWRRWYNGSIAKLSLEFIQRKTNTLAVLICCSCQNV